MEKKIRWFLANPAFVRRNETFTTAWDESGRKKVAFGSAPGICLQCGMVNRPTSRGFLVVILVLSFFFCWKNQAVNVILRSWQYLIVKNHIYISFPVNFWTSCSRYFDIYLPVICHPHICF